MILAATALIMAFSMMVAALVSIKNHATRKHKSNSFTDWPQWADH